MAYDTVQIHELDKSDSVSGLDYVLLSQNEEAKACTVEKIRNIGATIDEGGWDKTASNEGVKQLKSDLATVKTDVETLKNNSSSSSTDIADLGTNIDKHIKDSSIHVPKSEIGDLTTLNTTNKDDLVSAINEVNANTGISAGSYARVYVNEKGKVTSGGTLVESDIPNLPFSKITGMGTCATKNVGMGIGEVPVINNDGLIDATIIPTCYGVATGTDNYEVTINDVGNFGDYIEGMIICIKIPNDSTGASTIDVNGWGATPILDNLGNEIGAGGLKANIPYNLCYNGTNFIVLGKGGGGNATPEQLVKGATATTDTGQIVGTMEQRKAFFISDSLADYGFSEDSFSITESNMSGIGLCSRITVSTKDEYLSDSVGIAIQGVHSTYVKSGVKVGGNKGFVGTFTSDATAQTWQILTGQSAYVNGDKITGTMVNLSSSSTIQHESGNSTKVIQADGLFVGNNTDGVRRVSFRYNGSNGFITGNTLFGLPESTVASSLGITSNKIVSGNTVCGVAGNVTAESLGGATKHTVQLSCTGESKTFYTLPFVPTILTCTQGNRASVINLNEYSSSEPYISVSFWGDNRAGGQKTAIGSLTYNRSDRSVQIYLSSTSYAGTYNLCAYK